MEAKLKTAAEKKLESLLEKDKQLKKQIASERAKLTKAKRKEETRRKILVGSYFMDKFKDRPDELKDIMNHYLIRPDDRMLFELNPDKPVSQNNTDDPQTE